MSSSKVSMSFQEWRKAIALYNKGQKNQKWTVPKRGSEGYKQVVALAGKSRKSGRQTTLDEIIKKKK
jgi:hypothetical protein